MRVDGLRLALLKPETYMNLSGGSVAAAARFFKTPLDSIAVVHDEVDLELGRLQLRLGGGLAGHNGLRSVRESLGSADFLRVRVGGRPAGSRRPPAGCGLRAVAVRARRGRRGARGSNRRRGRGARAGGPRPRPGAVQLARRATTSPARQPGARPPAGGWIDSVGMPLRAISHAMIEFEFHISPAASSSRPQTASAPAVPDRAPSGKLRIVRQTPWALDCLVRRPGSLRLASAEPRSEDPEASCPAAADGALGHDAALQAPYRRARVPAR